MNRGNTSSHKNVIFVGVALGMLAAAASQTIVSPALPVIISELGGVEHYSWVATSTLLASAITIPLVGKLSDIYGHRGFYIGGLVVFMLGSILAGAAQNFWWLVGARAIQGFGMGAVLPLAQTILGDILSPRERGKYMGYLGGVFGVASISGPLLGGWITDNFSWRWLFYINLPIGIAALAFVISYLHLPHVSKKHSLDYLGFVTLGLGLVAVLLATSWGGTQYPWGSWQILFLYAGGALMLAIFIINERYAEEPVIPLRLWTSPIFTLSNIANVAVSMAMFGAIYYIPVFAQGVLGVSVTNSGTITIPLMASMILVSIVVGRLITRTGRYKGFILAGTLVMILGYVLLTQLGYDSSQNDVRLDLIVVGVGLGAVLQTYTLIVQNAVSRENLGVATATTQFSRSVGATVGIALFGTILTSGLKTEMPKYLPSGTSNGQAQQLSSGSDIGSLFDPTAMAQLPDAVATGIREGLAVAMHQVYVVGVPIVAVAFIASLFIKELPLRTKAFADEDADKEMPRSANQNAAEAAHTSIPWTNGRTDPLPISRVPNMDSEATGDFYTTRQAAQEEMLRSLEVIERHYSLDPQLLEHVREAFLHDRPPWVMPLADFLQRAAQKAEER
jgi:EmrB/QacA subfamily drug resistance transporter